MDTIFEKMIKTFYQCFISSLIVLTMMNHDFGINTLKSIVISSMASGLCGSMNYLLKYLDKKEGNINEQKFFESNDDSNIKNNVRNGSRNDWDEYIR